MFDSASISFGHITRTLFAIAVYHLSSYSLAAVAADPITTTTPANATGLPDIAGIRDEKYDMIFPIICGALGIPIFGIVIAAAIYQPYAKKRKDARHAVENKSRQRAQSVKEKERMLPRMAEPGTPKEAPYFFPSSQDNLALASKSAV